MVDEPRQYYNDSFSVEKYKAMLAEIENEFPNTLEFRVAESPIFVNKELKIKILSTCGSIIDEIKKEGFKEKTNRAIPVEHFVPNENQRPDCLAIDFAITKMPKGSLNHS